MPSATARTLRERLGALRNLPPFLRLIWATNARLTATSLGLRLARAVLPVVTLYVGKLIIDEVIELARRPGVPATVGAWLDSGLLDRVLVLLLVEFALAVVSDVLDGWWHSPTPCSASSSRTPRASS